MTVSLLLGFNDLAHLQRDVEVLVAGRPIVVEEDEELAAGTTVELIAIHPDTGDSFPFQGEVVQHAAADTRARLLGSTLVRNQLQRFAGLNDGSKTVQQRLRKLKMGEVSRLAQTGELEERVALERMYGKSVWDLLLSNSKITVGEVIRIVRNGALPKPLLEKVVTNSAWVRVPQIRRALLTHRRLDGSMIQRVLRLTPANELKLIAKQTAYTAAVRAAAHKRIKL